MSKDINFNKWKMFLTEQDNEEFCEGENIACGCVDSVEASVSLYDVQSFLGKLYGTGSGGLEITYSGQFGVNGPGVPDEVCGSETRSFIIRFQKESGICEDACVGDETEEKMREKDPDFFKDIARLDNRPAMKPVPKGFSPLHNYASIPTVGVKNRTISIKGLYATHGSKGKENLVPGMINSVNVHNILKRSGFFKTNPKRLPWGNPAVAEPLIDAAAKVNAYDGSKVGIPIIYNISARHGGPISASVSHQVGLDVDCTFYNIHRSEWWDAAADMDANDGRTIKFDMMRNVLFIYHLVRDPRVKNIFIDQRIQDQITEFCKYKIDPNMDEANKLWLSNMREKWLNIYRSYKISHVEHHADHYHIRVKHPVNSLTLDQYKKRKNSLKLIPYANTRIAIDNDKLQVPKELSAGQKRYYKKIAATFNVLNNKSLEQLKKQFPPGRDGKYATGFGYTLGTIDGNIIEHWNQDSLFYGSSMPKTMAGLVQLITYKDQRDKQLTQKELDGMLTYWSRSKGGYPDSNRVIRGISRPYSGKAKYSRKNLGMIGTGDVAKIASLFGATKSRWLFGDNKQSSRDAFLFYAGLARMNLAKKGNPNWNKEDKLKDFYHQNKKEIDMLINSQQKRFYSRFLWPSGILQYDPNAWGKGGRYDGNLNFVFIIKDKFILSVYTQAKKRGSYDNDLMGYALLNTVLAKLLEKTRTN